METDKNLKEFIEQVKNTSPEIPADTVKSLIDSGKTSPFVAKRSFHPRRIKQFFNPLKILIMITPIIIIATALLVFNPVAVNSTKDVERQKTLDQKTLDRKTIDTKTEDRKTIDQKTQDFKTKRPEDAKTGKVLGVPVLNARQAVNPAARDTQLNVNHVSYYLPLVLPLENAIRLKPDALKCMGINYSPTAIDYKVRAMDLWFHIQLMIKDGNTSMSATTTDVKPYNKSADTLLPTVESIILMGVSNFGSMKIIDMPTRVYRQFNRKDMNWQDFLSLCVPVLVDGETYSVSGKDVVFWIYPNERFFACLPPEIGIPMLKEFNYQKKRMDPKFVPKMDGSIEKGVWLVTDTVRMGGSIGISGGDQKKTAEAENVEPVPCVYFTNLCESLPGLDYVNVYPNPATDKLNVDLILQKAKNIRFRVFDLGGRVISDEEKPQIYPEGGQFRHTLDVSQLQNGLYLLILTDDEGAKVTRRFVKN